MAAVDFGDSELFEQLEDSAPPVTKHIRFADDDDEEEAEEESTQLRLQLEESDKHIKRLSEENQFLRRKLNILSRPSGINITDVNIDGPLLQILYANNNISKQCRQEIEDCICNMILKHQRPGNLQRKSSDRLKPQSAAFSLDDDPEEQTSKNMKLTTEAFKVVGSVLHFTTFSVDKLGQPLQNESPQLTDGWEIPTYIQVFNQVIGRDGQEIELKDKRPKSMCFNCGSANHQLRDCPEPKDMAAINERRKEFNQNSQPMQSNHRYHVEQVAERFAKFKPGLLSEELLAALGIEGNTLPPLIYRMRQLGYPPGWLKEAETENSGLSLYDGNAPSDDSTTDNSQNICYDVSKLVDFPGFNVTAPHRVKDEFMQYGSIPMQSSHQKQNFAAYLSTFHTQPGSNSNKRCQESDSSPQQRKKMKSSPDYTTDRSSDMDIESDPGTPYNERRGDFQFQPPLPRGSPRYNTPPPLPQGTPPSTPTPPPLPKGTPPLTPNNSSPALRGRNWAVVDEVRDGTEDELSLEELEEQQRLIWAALENADTATNSDSETPTVGTPPPSSPSVFPPAHVEKEEGGDAMDTTAPAEPCHVSGSQREQEVEEVIPQNAEPIEIVDDSPQSPEPVKARDDSPQSPEPVKARDDSPQSPEPVKARDDSLQSPKPVKARDDSLQSPEPVKARDDSPQSPEPVKARDDSPQSPAVVKSVDDTPQSPDPIKCPEDNPQSPDADFAHPKNEEKISAVPHRSRFAAGIVPFEDTPEFTEVAEATGTYLRIRDLLKRSPRNLARKT